MQFKLTISQTDFIARHKLNIAEKDVVILYIEEDGTEVDDDETFMAYEAKTTFVVATSGQKWQPRQISQDQGQKVPVEPVKGVSTLVVQLQIPTGTDCKFPCTLNIL